MFFETFVDEGKELSPLEFEIKHNEVLFRRLRHFGTDE